MSENGGGARLEASGYRVRTQHGTVAVHPWEEAPGGWAAFAGGLDLGAPHTHADTPAEAVLVLAAKLRDLAHVLELAAEAGHG